MELRTQEKIVKEWERDSICVSICCLTYNHEKYIGEALDSFLMQETDFSFEILIHDDASTDNTANIIREYEEKYPDIIKPIYQTKNQKSEIGSGMNPTFNYPRAKGKYIALCDGDDYWTYKYKIKKQVLLLENNKKINFTFHNVTKTKDGIDIGNHKWPKHYNGLVKYEKISKLEVFTPPTSSIMFRNRDDVWNLKYYKNAVYGDRIAAITASISGDLFGMNTSWSVYRIHSKGIASGSSENLRLLRDCQSRYQICSMFQVSNETKEYHKNKIKNNIKKLIKKRKVKYIKNTIISMCYYYKIKYNK